MSTLRRAPSEPGSDPLLGECGLLAPAASAAGDAADAAETARSRERTRLMRDGLLSYAGFAVSSAVGIATIPLLLRTLGVEAYGFWVFAVTVATWTTAAFDVGLFWSVAREVAASGKAQTDDSIRFIRSAGNACLLSGIAGAAVIAIAALFIRRGTVVSSGGSANVLTVFLLVAAGFLLNQLIEFGNAVFAGLRRYDVSSIISGLATVVWGGGVVLIYLFRGHLLSVALWHVAGAATAALLSLKLIARLGRDYALRIGGFQWTALRSRLGFAFGSWLAIMALAIIWQGAPLLIALVLGPAQIVPYYVGLKLPVAVSWVSWHATGVLFPAASERQQANDPRLIEEIIEAGTRWNLVLALPLCIVLWILGPGIMTAWLGPEGVAGAATIMRLATAAVLAEALGASALHVLWGRGAMSPLLAVLGSMAAANLGLNLWLLRVVGPVGAAWVLLISMSVGCLVLLQFASRDCGTCALRVLNAASRGLPLPAAACAAVAFVPSQFTSEPGWFTVAIIALAALLSYILMLLRDGARAEERQFILGLPLAGRAFVAPLRRAIRRKIGSWWFARSWWVFALALNDLVRDTYRAPESFQAEYQRDPDPWKYDTAEGRRRFVHPMRMLEDLPGAGRLTDAIEIGCSEGVFTQLLARHCDALLAVDFAPLALERARDRCGSNQNVTFRQWDLRRDPLAHQYDLIVVMDVLSTIFRPAALQAALAKLFDGLRAGGYLLFGDVRQTTIFEQSWWNKYMMRGGMRICELLEEDRRLVTVATHTTGSHVFALFRKVS